LRPAGTHNIFPDSVAGTKPESCPEEEVATFFGDRFPLERLVKKKINYAWRIDGTEFKRLGVGP